MSGNVSLFSNGFNAPLWLLLKCWNCRLLLCEHLLLLFNLLSAIGLALELLLVFLFVSEHAVNLLVLELGHLLQQLCFG